MWPASASGTYRTNARGPGEIDVTAQASRADARKVYLYLPRAIDDATRKWLRTSLTGGTASDTRVKIAGNLAQFPFANGQGGQFVVDHQGAGSDARVRGHVAGDRGDRRRPALRRHADADRGIARPGVWRRRRQDARADRRRHRRSSAAQDRRRGDRACRGVPALRQRQPRRRQDRPAGERHGSDRRRPPCALALAAAAASSTSRRSAANSRSRRRICASPAFRRSAEVNGRIAFTEHDVRARDIAMETLGGPAKLAIASADGRDARDRRAAR